MTGFFTASQAKLDGFTDGKVKTCYGCGLYKKATTPKMKPYGNFKRGIMNIGEAPGETEDLKGIPFVGKTGRLLQRTYEELGIDLFEDCININAVNCRPIDEHGKNRTPTNTEIECCRKSVLGYIKQYKPKVIILLGNVALQSLLGYRWNGVLNGIMEWRGFTIPDQDFKAWVCPVFHPSYVERSSDLPVVKIIWKKDLQNAFNKIHEKFVEYKEPNITFLEDLNDLYSIKSGQTISFDYETTGLKPHAKGHKIVCCSVATSEDDVVVFEMPKDREKQKPFIDILKDKNILKMAHNCKFEENWSWQILKTRVRGWHWDSMLAAHILDNRKGVTGLKFQTYVNLGIVDYNMNVKHYLEADNSNGINSVEKLIKTTKGKHELMKYCALDSIHQYRIAMIQMKEFINKDLPF